MIDFRMLLVALLIIGGISLAIFAHTASVAHNDYQQAIQAIQQQPTYSMPATDPVTGELCSMEVNPGPGC